MKMKTKLEHWKLGDRKSRYPERAVTIANASELSAAKRKYAEHYKIAPSSVTCEKRFL